MRLQVRHETAYTYDGEVQASYNELRFLPPEGAAQHVVAAALRSSPPGLQRVHEDYYGNRVVYLEVRRPHRRLEIRTEVTVDTLGRPMEAAGRGGADFLQAGALTRADGETERALCALPAADPLQLMAAAAGLLEYRAGVTDAASDVNAALRAGAGVCQDFAHLFVAACRLHGFPARYVGGYLLHDGTGGVQHSHAWTEVHDGTGWRALDPTHRCAVDERYLPVAVGRDYADVPPVRGVFLGAASRGMRVRLQVAEQ